MTGIAAAPGASSPMADITKPSAPLGAKSSKARSSPNSKKRMSPSKPKPSSEAPALLAHLKGKLEFSEQTVEQATEKQNLLERTIFELTADMETLRSAAPEEFITTLSNLLTRRQAPMLFLDADKLRARQKLPCYAEVEDQLTPLLQVDASKDRMIFVSHRCAHRS